MCVLIMTKVTDILTLSVRLDMSTNSFKTKPPSVLTPSIQIPFSEVN